MFFTFIHLLPPYTLHPAPTQLMFYTYLLQSQSAPAQHYIGSTADLRERVRSHNAGENRHTSNFRPWSLAFYAAFQSERSARDFETYLKTHSGRLFLEKRLLSKA